MLLVAHVTPSHIGEIIRINGGPCGCDEVVFPSNYKVLFVTVVDVRFNPHKK